MHTCIHTRLCAWHQTQDTNSQDLCTYQISRTYEQAKSLLGADKTVVYVVGRDGTGSEYRTSEDGRDVSTPLAVR
jgi:hypothetical protein